MDVRCEIARFAKERWVGLRCSEKGRDGRPLIIRYMGGGRFPLKIDGPSDIVKLMRRYGWLDPRAFYATANIYRNLNSVEDVSDLSNIVSCTATWDIDNDLEGWKDTIAVAKQIVSFLEDNGISQSVFVKWSGEGCHVHLHHKSISPELAGRTNPLDLAYTLVEYVNLKLNLKYKTLTSNSFSSRLVVENEMDPQRLFSCPLTLHSRLDRVCVCISPNDLDRFTPEWTLPDGYRHYGGWDRYVVGEADQLASRAYETVGPRPSKPKLKKRRHLPLDVEINRFMRLKV
ncbi:MAG: hypothetical protein QXK72_00420 [Candidatus Bathyarchaeia archaeon]|nr:hypothetical protein [Candidatus Bathyarchaeota archaeon]